MSLLDSFDNNKKRCRECGEYFDITTSKINAMIGLCGRCFNKVFSEFKKPIDKKYELNKKANLLNKYSYYNYKWFKNE